MGAFAGRLCVKHPHGGYSNQVIHQIINAQFGASRFPRDTLIEQQFARHFVCRSRTRCIKSVSCRCRFQEFPELGFAVAEATRVTPMGAANDRTRNILCENSLVNGPLQVLRSRFTPVNFAQCLIVVALVSKYASMRSVLRLTS